MSGGAAEDRTRILAVRRGGFAADRAEPLQFYSMDDVAQKKTICRRPSSSMRPILPRSTTPGGSAVRRCWSFGFASTFRRACFAWDSALRGYPPSEPASSCQPRRKAVRDRGRIGCCSEFLRCRWRRFDAANSREVAIRRCPDLMAAHDAVDARDAVDGRDAVDAHDAVDASDAIDGRDAYDVGAEASRRALNGARLTDRRRRCPSSDRPVARPSPIAPLPARAPASARHEVPSGALGPGGTESSPCWLGTENRGRPRDVARRFIKPRLSGRKRVMIVGFVR